MPNKPSINDIPNRISANFFALIGFANFAILLSYIGKNFDYNIFVELILMYGFCIYLFGVISIASIPMIFPLFFLLRTNNKKTSNIFLVKAVKNAKKGLVVEKPIMIDRNKKWYDFSYLFSLLTFKKSIFVI